MDLRPTNHEADGLKVIGGALFSAFLVLSVIWTALIGYAGTSPHYGRGDWIDLIPEPGRLLFLAGCGAFAALPLVWCVRLLLDVTQVSIDDEGIMSLTIYGKRRGLWKDYIRVERRSDRGRSLTFVFRQPDPSKGKEVRVFLPGVLGVDLGAVEADAQVRLAHLAAVRLKATGEAVDE